MNIRLMSVLLLSLGSVSVYAADASLKTDKDKISYTLGLQFGAQLKGAGLSDKDLSGTALVSGVMDMLSDGKHKMSDTEMRAAFDKFRQDQSKRMEKIAGDNRKEGEEFLKANAKKKGVKTTASGLQYKMLKEGSGKNPTVSDTVTIHYKGTLISGKEFDSSHKRGQPATFALGQLIKGWQEGIPLMKPGGKMTLYVPSDLGYGMQAPPNIGPNQVLIFELELISVK